MFITVHVRDDRDIIWIFSKTTMMIKGDQTIRFWRMEHPAINGKNKTSDADCEQIGYVGDQKRV